MASSAFVFVRASGVLRVVHMETVHTYSTLIISQYCRQTFTLHCEYLSLKIRFLGYKLYDVVFILVNKFSNLYQYVYHNILIGYYSNLTLIFAIQDCVYSLFSLLALSFF